MNKLSTARRTAIIASLVEGNSIRATARMTDTSFNAVLQLVPKIGTACAGFYDQAMRNLTCRRLQCDEIWQFCYAKAKNVPQEKRGQFGYGDVWTWIAIDADTKLVPRFYVGPRDAADGRSDPPRSRARARGRSRRGAVTTQRSSQTGRFCCSSSIRTGSFA